MLGSVFILFYISATGMYTNCSKILFWLDSLSPDFNVGLHIFNMSDLLIVTAGQKVCTKELKYSMLIINPTFWSKGQLPKGVLVKKFAYPVSPTDKFGTTT